MLKGPPGCFDNIQPYYVRFLNLLQQTLKLKTKLKNKDYNANS